MRKVCRHGAPEPESALAFLAPDEVEDSGLRRPSQRWG